MESFESLVVTILERDGYWVRPGFMVELTKDEKRQIDRASCPRWEIDILAYKGKTNELFVVECKSYFDNPGVKHASFEGKQGAKRFKLFNEDRLRKVVFSRLKKQLVKSGACGVRPRVHLCLAVGKFASDKERDEIRKHFKAKRWLLWDDNWIREGLKRAAASGYDNQVAAVVAKLLLRK